MDPRKTIQAPAHDEAPIATANGFAALFIGLLMLAGGGVLLAQALIGGFKGGMFTLAIVVLVAAILVLAGLYTLQPNEAAILQLFGAYRGTSRVPGLRATNPFYTRKKLSLRARNLNGDRLKVNDKRGNPIEIAAAVVWRIKDTARALLDIDNVNSYVPIQAESALRHLANEYSYDAHEDDDSKLTLRGGGDEIVLKLKRELQERFEKAGLHVEDARLTHLAYAPEIAGAMLRRQQAEAVIAARKQIVHGAVSMVEMALQSLTERGVVELDDERRAAMVSNLLVVLCAESEAQPVINAGSLYQ